MAADRDEFWKKVTEIDTPEKLRALKPRQLREYQRYFVEVQYQPLAPADEKAALNHLDRLKEEFVRRRYGWATRIGITALCVAIIGIVIGMVRCRGNSNSADSRRPTSAAISTTPSVPAQQPMPTQQPTPDAAQGVNQSIPITLSVPVACNNVGEVVDLSGRLHAVIKFKRNNRYGSAYVHVNAQGVAGTGEITGRGYQANGETNINLPSRSLLNGASTVTTKAEFIEVTSAPGADGSVPRFWLQGYVHFTFHANGSVTVKFDNFTVDCSGNGAGLWHYP